MYNLRYKSELKGKNNECIYAYTCTIKNCALCFQRSVSTPMKPSNAMGYYG